MVRAIPVGTKSPSPKRGRGRPPKYTADGTLTLPTAALAPNPAPRAIAPPNPHLAVPPPPPPPPPADNPYYIKFVEAYWQKYGGDACYAGVPPGMPGGGMPSVPFIPPMPGTTMAENTTKQPLKKKKDLAQQQAQNLPNLTLEQEFPINIDRTTYFIGDPTADAKVLSEKSCYSRTRLFELFLTLPNEDIHWKVKGTKDIESAVGRIGLRCVYCATMPQKSRGERSQSFPSSISRLYHTVADMQHRHLEQCPRIPPRVRHAVHRLSSSANRGGANKMAPKTYWEISAKKLGMEDIQSEDGKGVGVRLNEDHSLIEKSRSVVEKLFVPMGEEKNAAEEDVGKSDDDDAEEEMDEEEANDGDNKAVQEANEGKSEESNEAAEKVANENRSEEKTEEQKIEKADQEVEDILARL